jgi:tetratricopeptide (TPR) repeat protein
LVRQPVMNGISAPGDRATGAGGGYQPLNVLFWKPAPLLIEWGCELLRKAGTPSTGERWWHLGALAVAQRSEDTAFLLGDPAVGRGYRFGEIDNTQDEIKHLQHSRERFPAEMRFMLAEAIARDRRWSTDAARAYDALAGDVAVGGEALMRLGVMQYHAGRGAEALKSLERAEDLSRDAYVVYVASYVRGRIAEAQRKIEEARDAYTRSVAVYPHGQSATVALAGLLFQQGLRAEAQALTGAMFAADPLPLDPWREYVHADDRFWPVLLAKLHGFQTADRR